MTTNDTRSRKHMQHQLDEAMGGRASTNIPEAPESVAYGGTTDPAKTEGLHPQWCDLEGSCTDDIVNNVVHYGRPMAWWPDGEECRVGIALVHGEDRLKGDPVDHGRPYLRFSLAASLEAVDVLLTAKDARFLAEQLETCARIIEGEPYWYSREQLTMSAVDYLESVGLIPPLNR